MIKVHSVDNTVTAHAYGYIETDNGKVDISFGDVICFTYSCSGGERHPISVSVNGVVYPFSGKPEISFY